jgi:ABC-type transport system involved in multi-copper enzyme maturation permease subunit
VTIVAGYALREALRRRVFVVVLALSAGFVALYALGAAQLFSDVQGFAEGSDAFGVDARTITGSTILGLAMFAVLFLGVVLAVFLTLGAVRGDAERGLLQPLIVRPLGRAAYVGGRLLAAGAVSGGYVLVLYLTCVLVTGLVGHWWPDDVVGPGLRLLGAAVLVSALSLLGSVLLSSTANGIAVFMVFGAGLTAGLLGQIGEALGSGTLSDVASVASWALPFEALYQDGLRQLTAHVTGTTGAIVKLGPFGGAQDFGAWLWPYAIAYLAAVTAAAIALFRRRDL